MIYMMVTIQFHFVYEMGEVYMKITCDNPNDYHQSLRFLKKSFIIIYFLDAIAFALSLTMIITIPLIKTDLSPLELATILSFLVIIGLLAVLIGYHFFKYYLFFVKMKYSKMEKKKLCNFRRGLVIFFHIFMILLLLLYTGVLLVEFGFYSLRNEDY